MSNKENEKEKKTNSRFDDVRGIGRTPGNSGRIALAEDGDGGAVDNELALLCFDASVESSVDGIVFKHVHHVFKVNEGAANRSVSK